MSAMRSEAATQFSAILVSARGGSRPIMTALSWPMLSRMFYVVPRDNSVSRHRTKVNGLDSGELYFPHTSHVTPHKTIAFRKTQVLHPFLPERTLLVCGVPQVPGSAVQANSGNARKSSPD